MRVTLTKPTAGAGKWCWQGWENAFKHLGHEIVPLGNDTDLLIASTSTPSDPLIKWRESNPNAKVAMNVLAWTDEDLPGIHNAGVQATVNNCTYARVMKADVVFAQYSKKWREILLKTWKERGFKLSSMEMAADSTVYFTGGSDSLHKFLSVPGPVNRETLFYVGGYWQYKAINIDKYLIPVLDEIPNHCIVGKGWPPARYRIANQDNEGTIGLYFAAAGACPNVHEPHSTEGGYDVVERPFKAMYCGGLVISDKVQEMEDMGFKHGDNCLIAGTPEEYLQLIKDAMNNPLDYAMMRKNARSFIKDNHTYVHRVKQLIKDVGLEE